MNYYVEKNGKTVAITDSEEAACRTAEAWEEMYPDATITIILEIEQ